MHAGGKKQGRPMPLLVFILIVLLIAQLGFWHTLAAIIGAVLMIVLLILLAVGILFFGVLSFLGRVGRGPRRY